MKSIYLAIISVMTISSAYAQKIHFADTSNIWKQFEDTYNDNMPANLYYETYHFVSHTTIDMITYHIFNLSKDGIWNLLTMVREATPARRSLPKKQNIKLGAASKKYNIQPLLA